MSVISLLIAVGLLIQLPAVQTRIADKVMEKLDRRIDGEIHLEKIHFQPFKTLMLKNVVIIDREPACDVLDSTKAPVDTFFRAGYIIAKFSFEGLLGKGGIHLNSVTVSDAQMNLVTEYREDPANGPVPPNNLSRIFHLKRPEGPRKKSEKELFHIKRVIVDNMGFTLKDYDARRSPYKGGINWNDLDIKGIRLDADDLRFKGGVMYGEANSLSFSERSGFTAEQMSGKARVGNGKTIIEDLHIIDSRSDLKLPLYEMSYENAKVFKYFTEKVRIDAEVESSTLSLETLASFVPALAGKDITLSVSGVIGGTVSDFAVKGLQFTTDRGDVSGAIDGTLRGITDISEAYLDVDLSGFRFTSEGINDLLYAWTGNEVQVLDGIAEGIGFHLDAQAYGETDRLNLKAGLKSDKGNLNTRVLVENLVSGKAPLRLSGRAATDNLDINSIIGSLPLGPLTMKTDVHASLGEDPDIVVDTLRIDRLNFNGYDYTGIKARGNLHKGVASGGVSINDPSLNVFVNGNLSTSRKLNKKFFLNGSVAYADLHALNFDKRGRSEISFGLNADVRSSQDGTTNGKLEVSDIRMENSEGTYTVNSISLTPHISNGTHKLRLRSDFADALYTGSAPITDFIKDVVNITAKEQIPSLFKEPTFEWSNESYEFQLLTHNTSSIIAFLAPGMFVNENTSLNITVDRNGVLDGSLLSGRIAKGDNYAKGIDAVITNADSTLRADINIEEIEFAKMTVGGNSLAVSAQKDSLSIGLAYGGNSENRGKIELNGRLERNEDRINTKVDIMPSALFINGDEWVIPRSSVGLDNGVIGIDSFEIVSGNQKIWADGTISENRDTLSVGLEGFDLSLMEQILKYDIGIKGKVTGDVELISPLESNEIAVDLVCDSTFLAGEPLGSLAIRSSWNKDLLSHDVAVSNDLDGTQNIGVSARISPSSKYLNAEIDLERLRLKHAEPFLKDVFSEMGGYLSGKIRAEGPLSSLDIASDQTRLDEACLRVAFTNVPYYADGEFHIDNTGVFFDDITIRDEYDGTGTLSGSINWDRFRNMAFDTRLSVNSIEALNIPKEGNEGIYGNVFGTGNISITGPMNSLRLSVDAVTARTGTLHIPMTNSTNATATTDLLRFKEPEKEVIEDPYELMRAERQMKENLKNDLRINVNVSASPDVTVFVELDESGSNQVTATGSGIINLEIGDNLFNINGDYTLSGGQVDFSALGIVNKTFEIENGSNIHFNGDIMQSSLDIDAIYKCKATLSNLLSDLNSSENRRDVNCGIQITGKLINPEIGFSIDVPDLNPIMQSRVQSALSTDDKKQRQMLSLLLTNSFLPDEQSGIVNNSSMLYSNVSEAMANQLNNILHKLDIPLDLGLNYQPTEQGTDLFDVAVSTQLFNNRVIVNGNIGNKQTAIGGTQNDVVGDVDIEFKVNNSGTMRFNLFSHSADIYSNYLDNTQRNGIGMTIQTEFNSLKKAIKDLFSSREKRKTAKMENEQKALNTEKVVLNVTRDDYHKQDKDDGNKRKALPDTFTPGRE